MKHLPAVLGALLCALAWTARAAGPEDQYIAIYYLIQQGDAASTAGNNTEASARYTDALAGLQKLQRAEPLWETNVVSYRLNYLSKRLAGIGPHQAGFLDRRHRHPEPPTGAGER